MPATTPRLLIPYPLPADAVTDYPTTGRQLAELLDSLLLAAVQPLRTVVIAAGTGTYNTPAGALALLVELVGAGGGAPAAAINPTNAGLVPGGGGGAFASSLLNNPAASYPFTVGASSASANAKAGASSFGSPAVVQAGGGSAGAPAASAGFAVAGGGYGGLYGDCIGQLILAGSDGGNAASFSATSVTAGAGGSAARGAGSTRPSGGTGVIHAIAGKGSGSGASGGSVTSSGTSNGALGGAGLAVITAFLPTPTGLLERGELDALLEGIITDWVPTPDEEPLPPVELPTPEVSQ